MRDVELTIQVVSVSVVVSKVSAESPSRVPSPVHTPTWLFTGVPTFVTSPIPGSHCGHVGHVAPVGPVAPVAPCDADDSFDTLYTILVITHAVTTIVTFTFPELTVLIDTTFVAKSYLT